ncbi:hypothetical protein NPIL_248321, partial [Nephila pilipes]
MHNAMSIQQGRSNFQSHRLRTLFWHNTTRITGIEVLPRDFHKVRWVLEYLPTRLRQQVTPHEIVYQRFGGVWNIFHNSQAAEVSLRVSEFGWNIFHNSRGNKSLLEIFTRFGGFGISSIILGQQVLPRDCKDSVEFWNIFHNSPGKSLLEDFHKVRWVWNSFHNSRAASLLEIVTDS